jgi:hypothetical protein
MLVDARLAQVGIQLSVVAQEDAEPIKAHTPEGRLNATLLATDRPDGLGGQEGVSQSDGVLLVHRQIPHLENVFERPLRMTVLVAPG